MAIVWMVLAILVLPFVFLYLDRRETEAENRKWRPHYILMGEYATGTCIVASTPIYSHKEILDECARGVNRELVRFYVYWIAEEGQELSKNLLFTVEVNAKVFRAALDRTKL